MFHYIHQMPNIYITALFTTCFALFIVGGIIVWNSLPKQRLFLFLMFLIEIPACAANYYYIRKPYLHDFWTGLALYLNPHLTEATVKESTLYKFIFMFEAPFSEELSKLAPLLLLLIPAVYRFFKDTFPKKPLMVAMSLGLGFGVGEMWFIAYHIAKDPNFPLLYSNLHWYEFGGYMGERLMVCIFHGAFTSLAVMQIGKGLFKFLIGIWGAMFLHFMGNFPIFCKWIHLGGLSDQTWMVGIQIYLAVYLILMVLMLAYLHKGKNQPGAFLFGDMKCPECGEIYHRPFIGLNAYPKRYEKCAHCKKWHWVNEKEAIKPEA